jgi:hypothetical protein
MHEADQTEIHRVIIAHIYFSKTTRTSELSVLELADKFSNPVACFYE